MEIGIYWDDLKQEVKDTILEVLETGEIEGEFIKNRNLDALPLTTIILKELKGGLKENEI